MRIIADIAYRKVSLLNEKTCWQVPGQAGMTHSTVSIVRGEMETSNRLEMHVLLLFNHPARSGTP